MAGVLSPQALTMEARLTAFLTEATRTRFALGQRDCLLWLADWLIALGHPDYVRDWRGAYAEEADVTRILDQAGGVVALIEQALHGGLQPTDQPIAGDVGVVRVRGRTAVYEVGAIRALNGWALLKTDGGVWISSRLKPIAAWRAFVLDRDGMAD